MSMLLTQRGVSGRALLFREATTGLQIHRPLAAPKASVPAALQAEVPFLERRRIANDVAETGVYPIAIKAMVGCYAALFAVFWAIFVGRRRR